MPTETPTATRLIDANALIEEMKDLMDNENEDDEWNKPLKFALKLIESAPTVEAVEAIEITSEDLDWMIRYKS